MHHRFASATGELKTCTLLIILAGNDWKKNSWVTNVIFNDARLFLENVFPRKQYRIWIYTSPRSAHTQNIEMVFQIQYDTPWKLFDTYLTGLNVAPSKYWQVL